MVVSHEKIMFIRMAWSLAYCLKLHLSSIAQALWVIHR